MTKRIGIVLGTRPDAIKMAPVVAHLADHPYARETCEVVLSLVRQFLTDAGVTLLPADISGGPVRALRFRPSMGWIQTR